MSHLLRAAGAERWPLDRLCLDDNAPLQCEVNRVCGVLNRLATPSISFPVWMLEIPVMRIALP